MGFSLESRLSGATARRPHSSARDRRTERGTPVRSTPAFRVCRSRHARARETSARGGERSVISRVAGAPVRPRLGARRRHVLPHQPGEEHRPGAAALREEPAGGVAGEAQERGASKGRSAKSVVTRDRRTLRRCAAHETRPAFGSDRPFRRDARHSSARASSASKIRLPSLTTSSRLFCLVLTNPRTFSLYVDIRLRVLAPVGTGSS
jgi:hypothetical protein